MLLSPFPFRKIRGAIVTFSFGKFFFLLTSYAGKIVNIRRLDEVINSINGWYIERGLFGLVGASQQSDPLILIYMMLFPFWFPFLNSIFNSMKRPCCYEIIVL